MRAPCWPSMLPDSITHAIERVKGRLIHIASPGEFANAIVQTGARRGYFAHSIAE